LNCLFSRQLANRLTKMWIYPQLSLKSWGTELWCMYVHQKDHSKKTSFFFFEPFLARAYFIGILNTHFSHRLGPVKALYSLLTVLFLTLSFRSVLFLACLCQNIQKYFCRIFLTVLSNRMGCLVGKSGNLRQKYFLDVLSQTHSLKTYSFLIYVCVKTS